MRAQPLGPLAADFNGGAANVAGVDKECYRSVAVQPTIQLLHRRVAKLTDIATGDPQDGYPIRKSLNDKLAVDAIVLDLLRLWRHTCAILTYRVDL